VTCYGGGWDMLAQLTRLSVAVMTHFSRKHCSPERITISWFLLPSITPLCVASSLPSLPSTSPPPLPTSPSSRAAAPTKPARTPCTGPHARQPSLPHSSPSVAANPYPYPMSTPPPAPHSAGTARHGGYEGQQFRRARMTRHL